MFLDRLSLVNFRNYTKTELPFSGTKNFIYGLNAQGKTNLLEAIYLLCLGRSFRLAQNQELLKNDSDFFTIEGTFCSDNQLKKRVIIRYVRDGKKEISINHKKLARHSQVFGQLPVVILSPEDYRITTGGPQERRRFVDILLSQVSGSYLSNLQEYTRILKQRNRILQQIQERSNVEDSSIDPWTANLINFGSKLLAYREKFVIEFSKIIQSVYRRYTETKNDLHVDMASTVPTDRSGSWDERFATAIEAVKYKEKRLGMTLVGPHRDDFILTINDFDLRKYGSRGEHKSVLIAMKMAEFNFIKQKREETPILLLDDFFSELDMERESRIFTSLPDLSQIFLTSPRKKTLESMAQNDVAEFYVEEGRIEIYK